MLFFFFLENSQLKKDVLRTTYFLGYFLFLGGDTDDGCIEF